MSITQKLSNEKIFSLREVLAKGPYTQNPRGFRWARKETFFRLWEYRGQEFLNPPSRCDFSPAFQKCIGLRGSYGPNMRYRRGGGKCPF